MFAERHNRRFKTTEFVNYYTEIFYQLRVKWTDTVEPWESRRHSSSSSGFYIIYLYTIYRCTMYRWLAFLAFLRSFVIILASFYQNANDCFLNLEAIIIICSLIKLMQPISPRAPTTFPTVALGDQYRSVSINENDSKSGTHNRCWAHYSLKGILIFITQLSSNDVLKWYLD